MATSFTKFPQLITELRLIIWQLALPEPLSKPLYPYRKGCWILEDLGLEPDPNGEDLSLEFKTSLLEPLRIEIPLYFVNREARGVTIKYVQKHNLTMPRDSAQSHFGFLRHFDHRTDTMFLPLRDVDTFFQEQVDRAHAPDLQDRYVSYSFPILPRLAIPSTGFEALKGELDYFFAACGPICTLYVVDVTSDSTRALLELNNASEFVPLELEHAPCARLVWRSAQREWESSGDDQKIADMRPLVAGLDDPGSETSKFDLDVQLVHLATRRLASSPAYGSSSA